MFLPGNHFKSTPVISPCFNQCTGASRRQGTAGRKVGGGGGGGRTSEGDSAEPGPALCAQMEFKECRNSGP